MKEEAAGSNSGASRIVRLSRERLIVHCPFVHRPTHHPLTRPSRRRWDAARVYQRLGKRSIELFAGPVGGLAFEQCEMAARVREQLLHTFE